MLLDVAQHVEQVPHAEADVRHADALVIAVHPALDIGVLTSAPGSRSRAARSMARNRSVPIGFSRGGLGGRIVVQWAAVSAATRTSSARTAAVSWSGSRRMSSSADASAGITFVLFDPWSSVREMVLRRIAFQ